MPRQTLRFDTGWLFHLGEVTAPLPNTHLAAYMVNKAGYARGPARRNFDDSDWRPLNLPHDWSVEGRFQPDHHVDAGFLPRGVGWYRRHFRLDELHRGHYIALQFDGVATHCTIYVNGHLLHRHYCGYTPFTVDLSQVATFGDELNVVAVHVDATFMEGWWYEGAGIYRHVWLITTHALHVAPEGLFVHPQVQWDGSWVTHVSTEVANTSTAAIQFDCLLELLDPALAVVSQATVASHCPALGCARLAASLPIQHPQLWSLQHRHLYQLRCTLHHRGQPVDQLQVRFGYRTIRFDAADGFFLNGQPVKLKGTCNHQDHAGVGVAVPDTLQRFRIRRLLSLGSNAYRSAHNPPAPELLDACDELGMLVIDENRNFGSSPQHLEQLRAMVRRDRNHPCIIAWSLCNEEAIQGTPAAGAIANVMQQEVKRLDPTRPVTAAVSGGILSEHGIASVVEVLGINYQLPLHDTYHAAHPHTPLLASETHCVLATRGIHQTNRDLHHYSALGTEHAPWGATAAQTWRFISARSFIAGLFIWTGFDYRGEPTPDAWPCVHSHFGLMDLCGFEKDDFYLHKAYFSEGSTQPFIHLVHDWNKPQPPGQPVQVKAYTNAESAELFLNGTSLGRLKVDPIAMAEWTVPYSPAALRAVAYRGTTVVAQADATTVATPIALRLLVHPDFETEPFLADGRFAIPVTVCAVDSDGARVPAADHFVQFAVQGPASIIGVGNGDPACREPNKASSRSLFNGLAQVILQTSTQPGQIILTATARDLANARLEISTATSNAGPSVPTVQVRHLLADWRRSPVSAHEPDLSQPVLAQDMNSWERVDPLHASAVPMQVGHFVVYRTNVNIPRAWQALGAVVCFSSIVGRCRVLLDTQPIQLDDANRVHIPAAVPRVSLSVLIQSTGEQAGILGPVELLPAGGDQLTNLGRKDNP